MLYKILDSYLNKEMFRFHLWFSCSKYLKIWNEHHFIFCYLLVYELAYLIICISCDTVLLSHMINERNASKKERRKSIIDRVKMISCGNNRRSKVRRCQDKGKDKCARCEDKQPDRVNSTLRAFGESRQASKLMILKLRPQS